MPRDIAGKVAQAVEPIIEELGCELVEVEYLSEHGRWVLRITADKEGGITLEDCARISREVENGIEVADTVPHAYVLEVSSPGLNRPLTRRKDFSRAVGQKVKVRTATPLGGRRNFSGQLQAFSDDTLYLRVDGKEVLLALKDVEKANLVYEFDSRSPGRAS